MRRVRIRETGTELPHTFLVCQLLRTLGLHELLVLLDQERLRLLLLLEVNLALDFLQLFLASNAGSFLVALCD